MFLYDGQSETTQAAALAQLAAVAGEIAGNLTAPGSAAAALAVDLPALTALAPDDSGDYAVQLQILLADYVGGIVADAANAPPGGAFSATAGYEFASRLPPAPADPSFGLAGLAALPASVPANAAGQVLANWQALAQLLQGCAVVALASLYAQADFASSGDADAARTQLYDLIVAQIVLAFGNDSLVQGWRALLTSSVDDLTVRAKGLPDIATLTTLAPMPALWLAQFLYQDGSQAPQLVQRNAVPHPLFCPRTIEYLEAA